MGRPKDEFVWQHVVEGAEKDARKCIHCSKEFRKASATRMIKHLAGLGNDISTCAAVHPTVREEAAKRFQILKQQRKGRISSVQEQTAIDNPTVGAVGPSNIQFNTTQATVVAVEPTLTDTTDVRIIRVFEECDPHFLPGPDPVDATGEDLAVTDMNTNHVREDGEMMRLLTATDNNLFQECDPHFLPGPDPVDATGEDLAVTDMITAHVRRPPPALPRVMEEVNARHSGSGSVRLGPVVRVNRGQREKLALSHPPKPSSALTRNRTRALSQAPQHSYLDAKKLNEWLRYPYYQRMDANMRVEMLSDNSLGIADEINRIAAIPLFSEDIFNGGDRRTGASSNSFNQHMSNLLPTLSLSSINNLITPSARRAVSLDIDSIAVSMAHLEPPSCSHPIQVAADNGDASLVPLRKNPTSHVSKIGHKKTFVQDPSASTSNSLALITKKAKEVHVTEAFMKCLLMFNSSSRSVISDFTQDPCFREFLKRAAEHGVPLSLLVDDSNVMRTSVFNMKEEVYQNTLMLKESWKTTGCTVTVSQRKLSRIHKKHMVVVGFYCPKGVVFMEAPDPMIDDDEFLNALKRHSPSLGFDDQITYLMLRHGSGGTMFDWADAMHSTINVTHMKINQCLQDEIEEICIDSCTESAWAQSLINKVVDLHEKICSERSLRKRYYKILEKNCESFKDFENTKSMSAFRLSIFLSIMRQRHAIQGELLLKHNGDKDLEEYSKLWDEGWQLEVVLNSTLSIPDLMDTLVPTNGYLAMAIKKVDSWLSSIWSSRFKPSPTQREDALTFWKEVESKLRGTIEGSRMRNAANYLNPDYFLLPEVQKDPQLHQKVTKALINYTDDYYKDEHSYEGPEALEILEEVERYGDVFRKLFAENKELKYSQHPLKLWEEHGKELPKLRSYAIELLSQPLSCMCKQVKKHMKELQGAEDYILRLNLRMIHEFKLLGDDIFKPLDFNKLRLRF